MNINQFARKLAQAMTTKQAEKILHAYLATFGFQHYAVTYYAGHTKSGRKLHYDYVSPSLQIWHQYYLAQAFADIDRTLEKNHTSVLPIFWDVNIQLAQAKNSREKLLREESIKFGIDKGLSIPVHGPNDDFICLTLHQCIGQTSLENYEILQYEWMSAAQIFYHYLSILLALKRPVENSYQLTKREQQCLTFTAKAWRLEEIAKQLKITPRTVNFHLQNANKKMGTNNKYLAMIKFIEK